MLLYQATHVPVGEDQKQHLELARDIAQKFNNDFCAEDDPVFTLPEPIIPPEAARIMSLRDGSAKMSKSDPSDMSRINLTDDAETIMQKVRKAEPTRSRCPERKPGSKAGPRRRISSASMRRWRVPRPRRFSRSSPARASGRSSPRSANCWWTSSPRSTPGSSNCAQDRAALDAILRAGAEKARALGKPTLDRTYAALGFLRD